MQHFNSTALLICILLYCSLNPNLSMSLKTKLQTTQNSCIRYCLQLKHRSHIGKNEFKKINWLPISNRVDQYLVVTAYNFKNALSPKYMGDIYPLRIFPNIRIQLCMSSMSTDSFVLSFYKKEIVRKSISYSGSKICNDLNQDIKASPSTNNFKHASKRRFFKS